MDLAAIGNLVREIGFPSVVTLILLYTQYKFNERMVRSLQRLLSIQRTMAAALKLDAGEPEPEDSEHPQLPARRRA